MRFVVTYVFVPKNILFQLFQKNQFCQQSSWIYRLSRHKIQVRADLQAFFSLKNKNKRIKIRLSSSIQIVTGTFKVKAVNCLLGRWFTWMSSLGGSVGCAVRLETRRSRVQPPPRSATFFRGDWSWNIFYGHSLPSADSRRAVVSFWRKNVHNTG